MWFTVICFVIFIAFLGIFSRKARKTEIIPGEHILITGGSSGIGKSLAIEVVKKGASVTLIGRNQEKLEESKREVQQYIVKPANQKVITFSLDTTAHFDLVEQTVKEAENYAGPISILVNCAGTSVSSRFEDTSLEDFKRMMDINYFGSVQITRAILPSMKERKKGRIVFVSSLAGLIGLYGFTAYSASKFALVGLAEALQMEVKPYNISVTVSFPPDTDTPGFVEEQKTKPIETARISESGGLFTSEQVAIKTLQDTMSGKFMSTLGLDGWLLCTLCSGLTPVSSFVDLVIQVFTMGILRIVGAVILSQFNKIVVNCAKEREKAKKPN